MNRVPPAPLPLRVTLDAQVGVTIDEQLLIDGAVW